MGALSAIAQVAARLLAALVPDHFQCRLLGRTLVGHDNLEVPEALYCFHQEFQRRHLVSPLPDASYKRIPFVIDRAPQVVRLTSDLQRSRPDARAISLPVTSPRISAYGSCLKISSEAVDSEAHAFVAKVDTKLIEKVPTVRKRESGNRTYFSTPNGMISGEVLKYRNEFLFIFQG